MKHLAIIPGDGIGKEVIAAGMEVLDAVSEISSFQYDPEFFDIGSDRYLRTGELLTDEDISALKGKDAIYFGAIGDPRVQPGVLEQGILLKMRAVFDQYINLRPVTSWFPLVPLKREVPFDIHFLRENTEDFYMGANGFFGPGHGGSKAHVHVDRELYGLDIDIDARSTNDDDFAFEIGLLSRRAVTRFADYACRYALKRGDTKVTLVDKANVITKNYGMQRQIFQEKAREYGLDLEFMFVDAMAMAMIVRPETFGTVAVPNLAAPGRTRHGREREHQPRGGQHVRADPRLRAGHRRKGHSQPDSRGPRRPDAPGGAGVPGRGQDSPRRRQGQPGHREDHARPGWEPLHV